MSSEGSLLLTGRADLALSGARGAEREGEITSTQTQAVGGGKEAGIKGNQKRIR